jgi:nicotinic acid mononucleotide adenylyltransferase
MCRRGIQLAALVALLCGADAMALAARALLVYPGSFDPLHLAHVTELVAAQRSLAARHPDGVAVVVQPNHDAPRHVPRGYAFDASLRVALARLATQDLPGVTVHDAFPDGTETADQLEAVRRAHPGHVPYLLVGDDAYAGMGHWQGVARVLAAFNVIVSTPPARRAALRAPAAAIGAAAVGYVAGDGAWHAGERRIEPLVLEVPSVRSHEVRLRLLVGRRVDDLVGRTVARALRGRRARAALSSNARDLLRSSLPTIRSILGPSIAERAGSDDTIAASLLALSNTRDEAMLRRVAHNLRRRGVSVSLTALRRLAQAPAHARVFTPPASSAPLARRGT